MIAVVADDITGAAEIAGIGYSYGMKVVLTVEMAEEAPRCDLLVVITNTRSASEAEAVRTSDNIGEWLRAIGVEAVYKKCDSVLRGHVAAELRALIDSMNKSGALLLPANPSMDRKIVDGEYYVDGKPISQTAFALDPEYPAKSSKITEMLGCGELISANSDINISGGQIYVGNVAAEEVLRIYSEHLTDDVLPAGGGSFFKAYLERKGFHHAPQPSFDGFCPDGLLMVCGSTMMHRRMLNELKTAGVVIEEMPESLYHGHVSAGGWIEHLDESYSANGSMVMRINQPVATDVSYAIRLKKTMAEATTFIVEQHKPRNLVVEGGATAYCIIERLGWKSFDVAGQLSTGVISLRPHGALEVMFTLKPGSYNWPDKVMKT